MRRLREQIKPPQTLQHIPPLSLSPLFLFRRRLYNPTHISRLRMHITTHINHPARTKLDQLLQKPLITSFPRRIDDYHCLVSLKVLNLREDVGRVAGEEGGDVREVVEEGVGGGRGDGGGGEFDA